jgi:hypothetical protein
VGATAACQVHGGREGQATVFIDPSAPRSAHLRHKVYAKDLATTGWAAKNCRFRAAASHNETNAAFDSVLHCLGLSFD